MNRPDPGTAGSSGGKARRGRCVLIMVVDDDPELRGAIRLLLPKQYEVIGLAGGEEFLEMVQAYQPDLIILDVQLPGRDGFALCRELRGRADFRRIPILFLTALDEAVGFPRSLKADGDAYLTKPFDPRELLAAVGRLLDDAAQ